MFETKIGFLNKFGALRLNRDQDFCDIPKKRASTVIFELVPSK